MGRQYKFNASKDGKLRCTLRASYRLTLERFKDIQELHAADDYYKDKSFAMFVNSLFRAGIEDAEAAFVRQRENE